MARALYEKTQLAMMGTLRTTEVDMGVDAI